MLRHINWGLKLFFLLINLFLFSSIITSAQGLFKSSNPTVARIGDEKIKLEELESFYTRNYPQDELNTQNLKEFLEVYSLYRAKIKEAIEIGLHLDEQFLEEVFSFDKSAASAYWIENSMKESLLNEFIERSQIEYLVSHVLIRIDENAQPNDTLIAYQKIIEAREAFLNGVSMDSLNIKYSSRVRQNPIGGDIPWFTAGVTVYDFENAVYNMEAGDISMPVRSQFGYHLIHVKDKRSRTPGKYVSHIFFRNGINDQSRIDSALVLLSDGVEWNEVVIQYSDDRQSALNGGSLGLVGFNLRFPEEFSNTILNIDPSNSWSEPIQTQYGVHIFKIDSVEKVEVTPDRIDQLEQQLRQLPRYKLDEDDVIERIQNSEYYTEYVNSSDLIDSITSLVDGESDTLDWGFILKQSETVKFVEINGKSFTSTDALEWIHSTYPETSFEELTVSLLDQYKKDRILNEIGDITANLFTDFSDTRKQFYNGLLVFKINEKNIWDPKSVDSTKVREYFDLNIENYEMDTDSLLVEDSLTSNSDVSPDQLFEQMYFRVFSDMQETLENEFNEYLFNKYNIRLYPRRVQ